MIMDARESAPLERGGCHKVLVKTITGSAAKEKLVQGLDLYINLFSDENLSKLNRFANELRVSGRNGKLSGETFCSYNHQKRYTREFIQFGVPIFWPLKLDETDQFPTRHIEPIPAILQCLIEQMIQRNLIPENKRPNGCRIDFFDEAIYSHPFAKPPHLERTISTLVLSQSRMIFFETIPDFVELYPLKKGSLVVINEKSSDATMHCVCGSPNKRITITFFKVLD